MNELVDVDDDDADDDIVLLEISHVTLGTQY